MELVRRKLMSNKRGALRWKPALAVSCSLIFLVVAIVVYVSEVREMSAIQKELPDASGSESASRAVVEAVDSLKRRLTVFSDPDQILSELAMTYHSNRMFIEANKVYSILSDRQPENARWPYLMADVSQSMMDFESYEAALKLYGGLALDYGAGALALGNSELRQGNYSAAMSHFERAIELEPLARPAYDSLYRAKRMKGEKTATTVPKEGNLLEKMPDPWLDEIYLFSFSIDQLLVRVDSAVTRGDFDLGLALLDRALAINPDEWKVHIMRVNVFSKLGELGKSLDSYRAAIRAGADEGAALGEISSILLGEGLANRLASLAEEAIERNPNVPELHRLHARALKDNGDFLRAESSLEIAVQLMPESSDIQKELGEVLWARAKYSAAAERFKMVASMSPLDIKSRTYLAQYYIERGNYSQAEVYVNEALALDAENVTLARLGAEYFVQYASSEARRGRWSEVERLLVRRAELTPLDFPASTLLVSALAGQGKRDEALLRLRELAEREPGKAEIFMTLGDLYLEKGNREDAKRAYRRALSASEGLSGYAELVKAASKRLAELNLQ